MIKKLIAIGLKKSSFYYNKFTATNYSEPLWGRLLKNSPLSRGMFIYGIFLKNFSENMSQKRKKIVLVDEGEIYENYKEI